MAATDLKSIFDEMPGRFRKGVLDKEVSFYFSLGDGPGQKWTIVAGPESCSVEEGKKVENADCVLKTSAELFAKMILQGYSPGFLDFTRGKVKSNNPTLLQELKKAFGL